MTPLFDIAETPKGYLVTEHFPEGQTARITLSSQLMVDSYIQARTDMRNLGHDGAIEKWIEEEKQERRRLGLSTKTHTQPHHYGTSKEAACGVHKGVEGNRRLEVVWHTLDRRKVDCPECLEAMERK